jgi:hypothetical protein
MGFLAALTRRRLLGGAGALTLLPVAARAATPPAPSAADPPGESLPLSTEFVLEIRAEIGAALQVGPSAYGTRRLIPITGGTFDGPRLRGAVVSGGADWQLERPDGVTTVEAKYTLKVGDGTLVSVTNRGIIVPPAGAEAMPYVRTVPEFEAPIGAHDWLNKAVFVGSLDASQFRQGRIRIRVFRVV